ncbi:hypothetical protein [Wenzhou pacific spadenose shark paramyxovirus]|uniref:Uncharacterized protein n=1 Tax=Wenzhou pacific spadenose shark paramyxovirus TaxID=2116452 RepID=A0A2P1GN13_9MONO|nr:hypothetical protein QKD25_gp03 [Wenzhou pacific spadenose shark paramyxovirus]AVM87358.1 hypothetical protein [Wenzhou pacific spadenose shark paramyxovirus]
MDPFQLGLASPSELLRIAESAKQQLGEQGWNMDDDDVESTAGPSTRPSDNRPRKMSSASLTGRQRGSDDESDKAKGRESLIRPEKTKIKSVRKKGLPKGRWLDSEEVGTKGWPKFEGSSINPKTPGDFGIEKLLVKPTAKKSTASQRKAPKYKSRGLSPSSDIAEDSDGEPVFRRILPDFREYMDENDPFEIAERMEKYADKVSEICEDNIERDFGSHIRDAKIYKLLALIVHHQYLFADELVGITSAMKEIKVSMRGLRETASSLTELATAMKARVNSDGKIQAAVVHYVDANQESKESAIKETQTRKSKSFELVGSVLKNDPKKSKEPKLHVGTIRTIKYNGKDTGLRGATARLRHYFETEGLPPEYVTYYLDKMTEYTNLEDLMEQALNDYGDRAGPFNPKATPEQIEQEKDRIYEREKSKKQPVKVKSQELPDDDDEPSASSQPPKRQMKLWMPKEEDLLALKTKSKNKKPIQEETPPDLKPIQATTKTKLPMPQAMLQKNYEIRKEAGEVNDNRSEESEDEDPPSKHKLVLPFPDTKYKEGATIFHAMKIFDDDLEEENIVLKRFSKIEEIKYWKTKAVAAPFFKVTDRKTLEKVYKVVQETDEQLNREYKELENKLKAEAELANLQGKQHGYQNPTFDLLSAPHPGQNEEFVPALTPTRSLELHPGTIDEDNNDPQLDPGSQHLIPETQTKKPRLNLPFLKKRSSPEPTSDEKSRKDKAKTPSISDSDQQGQDHPQDGQRRNKKSSKHRKPEAPDSQAHQSTPTTLQQPPQESDPSKVKLKISSLIKDRNSDRSSDGSGSSRKTGKGNKNPPRKEEIPSDDSDSESEDRTASSEITTPIDHGFGHCYGGNDNYHESGPI